MTYRLSKPICLPVGRGSCAPLSHRLPVDWGQIGGRTGLWWQVDQPNTTAVEIVKRQKLDLGLTKQLWVDGCSAALPRVDIKASRTAPGSSRGGTAATKRGRGQFTSRGDSGRGQFTSRGDRGIGDPYQFYWRKCLLAEPAAIWSNRKQKSYYCIWLCEWLIAACLWAMNALPYPSFSDFFCPTIL